MVSGRNSVSTIHGIVVVCGICIWFLAWTYPVESVHEISRTKEAANGGRWLSMALGMVFGSFRSVRHQYVFVDRAALLYPPVTWSNGPASRVTNPRSQCGRHGGLLKAVTVVVLPLRRKISCEGRQQYGAPDAIPNLPGKTRNWSCRCS